MYGYKSYKNKLFASPKHNTKCKNIQLPYNFNLIKTGILVGIGLALHNFPEGLAIGSRFFSII